MNYFKIHLCRKYPITFSRAPQFCSKMANEAHLLGVSPDVLTLITDCLGPPHLAAFAQTSKATAHHVKYSKLMVFRKMCTWKHERYTTFAVESACSHAALAGNLKVLKHLRAVSCEWDEKTTTNAIQGGYLHILRWARSCNPPCPLVENACDLAIKANDLDVLKWLIEQGCMLELDHAFDTWITFHREDTCSTYNSNKHYLQFLYDSGCAVNETTMEYAARNGDLDMVQWLRNVTNCPWDASTCACAARGGHLHVLKWVRQNGCEWDGASIITAELSNHYETIEYVRDNGCPWAYDFLVVS